MTTRQFKAAQAPGGSGLSIRDAVMELGDGDTKSQRWTR
jgi:hypothetical protein